MHVHMHMCRYDLKRYLGPSLCVYMHVYVYIYIYTFLLYKRIHLSPNL